MRNTNITHETERLADYMQRHCYTEDLSRQFDGILGHLLRNFEERIPIVKDWNRQARAGFDYYEEITDKIGELFEMMPPFTDVLGPLYMAIRGKFKGSNLGQFFTPAAVSHLLSSLTLNEADFSKAEPVTLNEPCCGSGGLLLSGAQYAYQTFGKEALRKLSVTAGDVDPACVAMTTIQFMYNWENAQLPLHSLDVAANDAAVCLPAQLEMEL